MGRKKQEEQPTLPSMPEAEPEQKHPKNADAAREFLGTFPDGTISDFEEWAKIQYPTWEYNKPSMNSALSNARKERGDGTAPKTTRQPRQATITVSEEPTIADIRAVKRIADENGGVEELLKRVQTIEEMAKEVGGAVRLRKSLELLFDLTGGA